jgi:pyruvate/2-oxoglutarate dehydrogenase complex dihydrolipoamide acyltransferase (E2) component
MAFKFHLPDIGEGVVEGEIVGWKVKVGDKVALDQPLVEIMTDKATVEIPSPRAGTIAKINFAEGEKCPVGQVLVEIEEDGKAAAAPTPSGNGHGTPAKTPTPPPRAPAAPATAMQAIEVVDVTAARNKVLATPATRRLARELGVEIGRIAGTGRNGRVTTEDVKRYQSLGETQHLPKTFTPITIAQTGHEERIPLRGMRRRIAESMARSVHTAAHFTYVEEIDMTELVAVRDRAKARAAERGVKLNYLPFIVKAVVSGLKKWPQLNASLDEATQEIVRKHYYHIGIAAQGPQGLAVSVVRDADKRSIFDLSREIDRLGRPCAPAPRRATSCSARRSRSARSASSAACSRRRSSTSPRSRSSACTRSKSGRRCATVRSSRAT